MTTLELAWLRNRSPAARASLVLAACAGVVLVVSALSPLRLREWDSAAPVDRRTLLGIPNALDVLSNLPFALAGGLGLLRLGRLDAALRPIGAVLFAALLGVALGSVFYHLDPRPASLLADRLPMTVAFMAVLALVLGDRLSPRLARLALLPLIAAAAGSALVWYLGGETPGSGDLRPYALTQALPLVALPGLLLFFPGKLDERRLLLALSCYVLAKVCEAFDAEILALSGLVGGHALKHLLAGFACFLLIPRRAAGGLSARA